MFVAKKYILWKAKIDNGKEKNLFIYSSSTLPPSSSSSSSPSNRNRRINKCSNLNVVENSVTRSRANTSECLGRVVCSWKIHETKWWGEKKLIIMHGKVVPCCQCEQEKRLSIISLLLNPFFFSSMFIARRSVYCLSDWGNSVYPFVYGWRITRTIAILSMTTITITLCILLNFYQ